MTVHLPVDLEHAIRAEVLSGHFASEDDMVASIVRDYLQRKQEQAPPQQPSAAQEPPDTARKPIWERILERSAAIPDEEWDKLPVDGAEQHDHYINGVPKRQTAP